MAIELGKGVHRIEMFSTVVKNEGKGLATNVLVRGVDEAAGQPLSHSTFFNAASEAPDLLAESLVSNAEVNFDQASNAFQVDLSGTRRVLCDL